eukprot:TRINITY_DN118_c0_g2_i7.p1 TRINITY_DN118_c0_g2~~TRINITY_DN118_c0_g2_i7.p1  ORF type:complete len:544 (-),score=131.61 TRINITY_DN118_c0_g2_i7:157-1788(-)
MFTRTVRLHASKQNISLKPTGYVCSAVATPLPKIFNCSASESSVGVVTIQQAAVSKRHFSTDDLRTDNLKGDTQSAGIFNVKVSPSRFGFPLLGDGIEYQTNVFGLQWQLESTMEIMEAIFSRTNFLPRAPAGLLDGKLGDLSAIGSQMAIDMDKEHFLEGEYQQTLDVDQPGLLARNQLRVAVRETLDDTHFDEVMQTLQDFQNADSGAVKDALAKRISDTAFWAQWLIRGVLFEGKHHGEQFTEAVIRAPLSKIARATNLALGRHQMEFVYDDYTLKAAQFPERGIDAVDYADVNSIVQYIADIETPVGFNDIGGGRPEHNFRHNHSLMEAQMTNALQGFDTLMDGDESGWDAIVTSAYRAHKVFDSMLKRTTPVSYPWVRLPIKGTRGACGSVYPPTGVIYEGCGRDVFDVDGEKVVGFNKTAEFGQTGANSSMYKWLDTLTGTAHYRKAYELDETQRQMMAGVLQGTADPGKLLAQNPIESMQFAFDVLTRPAVHLEMLVEAKHRISNSNLLTNASVHSKMKRLETTYWVARHRLRHGQ